ncbi:MAG TPA: hypothetical protein PLK04_10420 [Bacillota bacterium]|nr:hypothetical protein [Bacillota bacterium]
MADNVYGVKLVVLTELNQDGSTKADGKVIRIATPQEVSYSPNIKEGAETELRGGDKLIATVKDEDELTSITATFKDAKLDIEAMAMIGGGTVTGTGETAKYAAPKMGDNVRTPFKAEIYSARYADGPNTAGDIAGYTKVTLNYAKGKIPSFAQTDKAFAVPSYTIVGTDNRAQNLSCYSIERVASLPTAG